jgi:two-component system sensor histidine kinase MtrB
MVARTVPEALRRGLTFWRRSIQARVVVSTVLLSAVVVTAVGWFLLRQVEQGLLDRRLDAVLTEVANENDQAGLRLEAVSGTDTNATQQAKELVEAIDASGQVRGFTVVMTRKAEPGTPLADRGTEGTQDLDLTSVPSSLIRHFDTSAKEAWTYTTIRYRGNATPDPVPGIIVGTRVAIPADGSTRTLYYLFPLDDVQDTLRLVTRALLTAGVLRCC